MGKFDLSKLFKKPIDAIVPEGELTQPIVARLNALGYKTWADLKGLSKARINTLDMHSLYMAAPVRCVPLISLELPKLGDVLDAKPGKRGLSPKGEIEDGEGLLDAARREFSEETGDTSVRHGWRSWPSWKYCWRRREGTGE